MSDVELLHFSEENLHTGEGARVLHQCGVPATYKIHTHDFYELYIMLRGGLRQIVNEVEYTQAEGDVVLIYPWENHVVIDHDLDTELYCLSILTSEMERMLDAYDVRERLRNMENRLIQLDSRALKDMDMMFRHMLLPSVLMREDYYRSAVGTIIQTFLILLGVRLVSVGALFFRWWILRKEPK